MIFRTNDSTDYYATPDHVRAYFPQNDVRILANWGDKDAIPFIVINGKTYIGTPSQSHYDLYEQFDLSDYSDLTDVKGRIWTSRKIVVTWEDIPSQYAQQIQQAFQNQIGIPIQDYTFLSDASFFSDENVVYAMPMKDFVSANIYCSELPQLYQRQTRISSKKSDSEDETTRLFGWNGVSGRLGKYLDTTWGDSVERNNSHMVLSESEFRKLIRNLVSEAVYKTLCQRL